jgi:prophage regulatory protein
MPIQENTPSNYNSLPETGFLRLPQIIGDLKAQPPIPPIIPISRSTLWNWVKTGRFPRPTKLGPRVTVWNAADVRDFISGNWEGNHGQN